MLVLLISVSLSRFLLSADAISVKEPGGGMQALASKLVSGKPTFEERPQTRRSFRVNQALDWKKEKVAHVLNGLKPPERSAEGRKASADRLSRRRK